MKYQELREKQQAEFNDFPCFYAFSNGQFEEGLRKLGATEKELYRGPGGMFYRKTEGPRLKEMFCRFEQELLAGFKDDAFLYDAFYYELANHEYCITLDPEDTFDALGLSVSEVESDPRMLAIYQQARRDYMGNTGE